MWADCLHKAPSCRYIGSCSLKTGNLRVMVSRLCFTIMKEIFLKIVRKLQKNAKKKRNFPCFLRKKGLSLNYRCEVGKATERKKYHTKERI